MNIHRTAYSGRNFEYFSEDNIHSGIMARVGTHIAPGYYPLCTTMIRDEWGMTGEIITDSQSLTPYEAEQHLAAGCDLVLTAITTVYPEETLKSPGGQTRMRDAAKHTLFMEANSLALELEGVSGYPIYKLLLIAYNVLTFIYAAGRRWRSCVSCGRKRRLSAPRP